MVVGWVGLAFGVGCWVGVGSGVVGRGEGCVLWSLRTHDARAPALDRRIPLSLSSNRQPQPQYNPHHHHQHHQHHHHPQEAAKQPAAQADPEHYINHYRHAWPMAAAALKNWIDEQSKRKRAGLSGLPAPMPVGDFAWPEVGPAAGEGEGEAKATAEAQDKRTEVGAGGGRVGCLIAFCTVIVGVCVRLSLSCSRPLVSSHLACLKLSTQPDFQS